MVAAAAMTIAAVFPINFFIAKKMPAPKSMVVKKPNI